MVPDCAAALPLMRVPSRRLPRGSIDCHFHVFGPVEAFPYAAGRSYTPPDAPLSAYEDLAETFGINGAVIIQPSVYGFDSRRTLAAMAESRLPMRAVLVVDPEISERALDELHALGVRGVRVNLLFGAGLALATAFRLADKLRERGWHLQLLADVSQLDKLCDLVRALNIPVVFDHLGHVSITPPLETEGFRSLLSLVRDGLGWVKLSGGYRITRRSDMPYDDLRPCVDALINANPQQLVWGTDWPHPSIPVAMPDDTDMLEMTLDWLRDEALAERILVQNPVRLYGFNVG